MTDDPKHATTPDQGGFERQDLAPRGILYFLLALGIATVLSLFGLRGLFEYLDHRSKMSQPEVNPLVTNVPTDTRHVAPGYPQSTFPSPKLEEDERGQLNGIRMQEEKTLYSYGWVDEKSGTVHIPIERAMDLIVQRGLPVRPQGAGSAAGSTEKKEISTAEGAKGNKDNKQ
ncbi:MAG TPA: hypothetical protein VNY51_06240 [Candidatus Dormibacteraeota bacterium]|nr:hypothetical protein [Candidatus Dormibacteraeota bacterium]